MRLPEPSSANFNSLINDIANGQIKIPQFQREFVWDINKSANLIDSIIKGYPIGTFIFWRTNDRLRDIRNIGNFELKKAPEGEYVNFVLDGQQRLTSLFASLKGLIVKREGLKEDNFENIIVDLASEEDEKIVKLISDLSENTRFISLKDLVESDFEVIENYSKEHRKKIQEYRNRIIAYNFSIIIIKEVPIDIATEIFTRINVGGKPLSLFEVMVAKTYDHEKNFDLSKKFKQLIDDLIPVGYDTISDATVLQTLSVIIKKECTRKVILKLTKEEVVDNWDIAVDAIKKTIDYFRSFYRIPVSQLLPYNALIIPFAYYFHKQKDKPTGDRQRYLQDYFWRCSLSARFSSSVETKMAQDILKIDTIILGTLPTYDWSVKIDEEYIKGYGYFSTGRSFIKAILCLYAYYEPKSFIDDSIVRIDNSWLKIASSKNYHHFFPKSYLYKKGKEDFFVNHIVNITIVDDYLNKREIRDSAPSKYMKKFIDQNENIKSTMESHLIMNIEEFGVLSDDYDAFFNMRCKKIVEEIKKRIIYQKVDEQNMTIINDLDEDDFEE